MTPSLQDDWSPDAPTGGADDQPLAQTVVVSSVHRATAVAEAQPNDLFIGPAEDPDRFELLGVGLQGGEGITWRGRYRGSLSGPVTYAIKQILPPRNASPGWPSSGDVERWHDQRFVLQSMSSPHLVSVVDIFFGAHPHRRHAFDVPVAGRTFRVPYLVMEWVSGATLEATIQAGDVPLARGLGFVADCADALDSLHSQTMTSGNPMLHRDIKPANVIVHPTRGAVVVDLGALRRIDDGEDDRGVHTRRYSAPEVLQDLRSPRTTASDLYSLGALAYFVVVGADPPAATERHVATTMRRELTEAAGAHGVREPTALADLITCMLDTDPRARPTRPRRWAGDVLELVTPPGQPASTRLAGTHTRPPSRRRRGLPIVVGGLVLAAAGALGARAAIDAPHPPAVEVVGADGFQAFGTAWSSFVHRSERGRLTITPPLGGNRYDHLWGFYRAGESCAATVEFDVTADRPDPDSGFGFAVAPRSTLVEDQPTGQSVQYEWQPKDLNPAPGSYIRPATLPGGAWKGTLDPIAAPDIRRAHHVRVDGVGTSLSVWVDGTKLVEYEAPPVECGGMAIRVWGAGFTFSDVRVSGT